MHPARIPKEYWRHRIQMAKAMGCNTIAAYIFGITMNIKKEYLIFQRQAEYCGIYKNLSAGRYVGFNAARPVCLCRMGFWRVSFLPVEIPDIKLRCMDPRYMGCRNNYIIVWQKRSHHCM